VVRRKIWLGTAVVAAGLLGLFGNGSAAAKSRPWGSSPLNTAPPTVSGTPLVGGTLTGNVGTWSGSGIKYSYQWLRCDGTGANCAAISGATGTVDPLSAGDLNSTMRFSVIAFNRGGSTSATSVASGDVTPPPGGSVPDPPSGLSATSPTANGMTLSWTASNGSDPAMGYDVYVNGTKVASASGTSSTVGSLTCGTSYAFAVDAFDAAGNTSARVSANASTSSCATAPDPPSGLSTSGPTLSGVTLSWTASNGSDSATGYDVYVNGRQVATTQGTSSTVGSLTCGTSYTFAVDAFDAGGNKSGRVSANASTSSCPSGSQIYWGAWIEGKQTYSYLYGGTWGNAPWSTPTWTRYEQNVGKNPSIIHWGASTFWDHNFSYWASTLDFARNAGALNLIDLDSGSVSLSSIASGSEDSAITTWAQQAKAYGHPFFVRFDWEMNGGWFPWGTTASNQNTPADYVAAWRHIYDIFAAQGATNVTWVWCPNTEWSGSVPYSTLYPGDAYVDWTCLDGYNKGSSSQSFSSIYSQSYDDLLKVAPTKPVMVGEVGSLEYGAGVKANWITNMLSVLPTNFPQVKALVWFNWRNGSNNGSWSNFEVESSASSQAAFSTGIAAPYYAAASSFPMPGSLKPIQPPP
jgi:chitodextrinase